MDPVTGKFRNMGMGMVHVGSGNVSKKLPSLKLGQKKS